MLIKVADALQPRLDTAPEKETVLLGSESIPISKGQGKASLYWREYCSRMFFTYTTQVVEKSRE